MASDDLPVIAPLFMAKTIAHIKIFEANKPLLNEPDQINATHSCIAIIFTKEEKVK